MDKILHCLCCNDNIRLIAITAKEMVVKAQTTHGLSRVATAALGRQLMMTAMLASKLKHETDCVTTVIAGNGVAGNMVCTGRYGALVKGYTPNPQIELELRSDGKLDVSGYVGNHGKLTVITDLSLKEPYIGTCNLISGEIAEDFAQYFMVSEQQPSLVYLGVNLMADTKSVNAGSGIWITALPNCPDSDIDNVVAKIPQISTLAKRLTTGDNLETVLQGIFADLDFRITEEQQTQYLCDCNVERLERALISIGEVELTQIIEDSGEAELTCQFCNKKYKFDKDDLIRLRREATSK